MAETKYYESFPEQAMNFAADGLTDGQIASRMDISRSSLYNYKQRHPEFAEAIEAGRDAVDDRVENRLLELALGDYSITIHVTDHEGRTRTTVKSAVPNLKAIQYWLERSDKRKGAKLDKLDKRDKRDKLDKLDKQEKLEEKTEQPNAEPELDPSEVAGLKSLAEYKAMYPADAGAGFSKKETQEFEDMMLVTFTEMERRKYNTNAAAEGRSLIPATAEAPRTVKGKYAPDMIQAWKDRAEFFEFDL